MRLKLRVLILLLLPCSFFISAQQTTSKRESLIFFDNLTGIENTKLYNGNRYYNTYKISETNHNFFYAPEYVKGDVVYDNEFFYNIDLKYDALKDVLVSKLDDKKSFVNLELIKQKVKSFTINNHKFINVDLIINSKELNGFAELITSSKNYTFFVKRKKEVRERIKGNKVVHLFYETNTYFLYSKGEVHKIKSYKSLRKQFPDYETAINTYYKSNRLLVKNNEYQFMTGLFKRLDETITNTSQKTN